MAKEFSPYDLGAIGRMMERERGVRDMQLSAAHSEVRERIKRLKESGELNAYDLGQTAYIFEPLNAVHRRYNF
jgi:hypothetical protein